MTSCQFNATLPGIGDFVVASATAGHTTPENSNVTDGKTYTYYAVSYDALLNITGWESGSGIYTVSTHTLKRTAIGANSDSTTIPVNFPLAPVVDVYASPSNVLESPVAFCRMSRRVLQSLVTNVITKVSLDTVDFDTGNISNLANSRMVIPVTGYYLISGFVFISGVTSNNIIDCWIYLNGAAYAVSRVVSSTSLDGGVTITDTALFTKGDVLELFYFAATGTPVFSTAIYPRISLVRLK